jgi:hypothetical protein
MWQVVGEVLILAWAINDGFSGGRGIRDPRPCCDRVKFTGHQQSEIAGMMDMISELA